MIQKLPGLLLNQAKSKEHHKKEFCLQQSRNATLIMTVQWLRLCSRQNLPCPNSRHAKITWLLTNWRNQRKRSSEQREPEWVRLLWRWDSDTSGSSPGATFPHFESWSFVSSKRAERIPSFFISSTRSPFWCICRRMSQPPTNSPLRYTCGMVGQLE